MLVNNGDDSAGAAAAFRLAAHTPEDSPDRRAVLSGADHFSHIVIGQDVAGTDDHRANQFGIVLNCHLYQ
jgi:hypothetical protein